MLEWIDPPFSSGHWTPELIALAGGRPLLGDAGTRSRTIAWDDVRAADPEILLIACCGFDVARTRRDLPILARQPGFEALTAVRTGRVYVTDGNAYFSRPGPRLVDSLEILGPRDRAGRCIRCPPACRRPSRCADQPPPPRQPRQAPPFSSFGVFGVL